jgi:hypothetical protein
MPSLAVVMVCTILGHNLIRRRSANFPPFGVTVSIVEGIDMFIVFGLLCHV